jgi:hypothetical protein
MKCELGKYISNNGYLNISYETNYKTRIGGFGIGLRFDLSFAQTGVSVHQSQNTAMVIESARGSLLFDNKTNYLNINNRTSVGKGGIVIIPFLDMNRDGKKQQDEPKVAGLKIRINGGKTEYYTHDTLIRVSGLEANINYLVELNTNEFDNINWQAGIRNFSVSIDANDMKTIELPVTIINEVSGNVYFEDNDSLKEAGRITVLIYNKDSKIVAHTITESDGSFNFSGLAEGNYFACIDPAQLEKLKIISRTPAVPFTIAQNKEGEAVDGLKFFLQAVR